MSLRFLLTLVLAIHFLGNIATLDVINNLPQQNASSIRLVYSLTTNPERVHQLVHTISSLLSSIIKPDLIQVNIPWIYLRTNETFENLDQVEILKHPLVKVHRCRDYGPITKLMGTLETEKDPQTLIVVVDDDWKYPAHLTQLMKEISFEDPTFVLSGHCQLTQPEISLKQSNHTPIKIERSDKECCCRIFEGFASVGYRVSFFQDTRLNFTQYVETALTFDRCFRSDDFVISNYLKFFNITGLHLKIRTWPTQASNDKYALYKQIYTEKNGIVTHGHPYFFCNQYLISKSISFMNVDPPPQYRTNQPVDDGSILQCAKDRTVYLIKNQTRCAFQCGTAFMNMGFEFDKIVKIEHDWCQ